MLDLSYFQNNNSNVQGFFSAGTWQTWIKPRGAKLVNIICQGSGAGGGGGFQSASTPRGGGGGGGTGATARLTIDAKLLPDILYILPGIGGAGGLGGNPATAGNPGQNSYVCLIASTSSVSNVVLRSGTTVAQGGGAGLGSGGGGTGAAETISVIANSIFANLGTFTFQAGQAGGNGGSAAGGQITATNFILGGAGGGGTGSGGSSPFSAAGVFPSIISAPVNTNGRDGIILYKPILLLYGGNGGGGSSAAGTNGGNGGNGAPGAGGGGGGASSNTGVNAGNGGRGGDGFVIITTSL